MASEEFDFKHNNFDIVRVRVVDLFGGYKEHKHKNEKTASGSLDTLTFKSSTAMQCKLAQLQLHCISQHTKVLP